MFVNVKLLFAVMAFDALVAASGMWYPTRFPSINHLSPSLPLGRVASSTLSISVESSGNVPWAPWEFSNHYSPSPDAFADFMIATEGAKIAYGEGKLI